MSKFRNRNEPISLLLLQALFSTTARMSNSDDGKKYFQRAKALFDAGYEQDRVVVVQALVLMSWYYDGPQGKIILPLFRSSVKGRCRCE